jgi:hypothetical protein
MRGREYIRHDDKAATRLAPQGDDGRFDLCVVMNGRSDCLVLFGVLVEDDPDGLAAQKRRQPRLALAERPRP